MPEAWFKCHIQDKTYFSYGYYKVRYVTNRWKNVAKPFSDLEVNILILFNGCETKNVLYEIRLLVICN